MKQKDEFKDKIELKNAPYRDTISIAKEYSEIVDEVWCELKLAGYQALS